MTTFYVYYRNREEFRNAYSTNSDNIDPAHYERVGAVQADGLDSLFRKMNVVDGSDEELVGRGKFFQVRSMSVGDVAIDDTGRGYLCSSVGWEAVDASKFSGRK